MIQVVLNISLHQCFLIPGCQLLLCCKKPLLVHDFSVQEEVGGLQGLNSELPLWPLCCRFHSLHRWVLDPKTTWFGLRFYFTSSQKMHNRIFKKKKKTLLMGPPVHSNVTPRIPEQVGVRPVLSLPRATAWWHVCQRSVFAYLSVLVSSLWYPGKSTTVFIPLKNEVRILPTLSKPGCVTVDCLWVVSCISLGACATT